MDQESNPQERPMAALISKRGRPVFGAKLGIIILETRFRRFPGDIGFAGSFSFAVQYAIARGFSDGAKISADQQSLDVFMKAVDDLVAIGVDGIVTSCGFLSIMQPQLQAYSPVPVATSSLLQIPLIERILPRSGRVGVLTADRDALTAAHLLGAGVASSVPIVGMPHDGIFRRNISEGRTDIDRDEQEAEVLESTHKLLAENENIGAVLLECTNLAPYSAAIEDQFGMPVYDVMTLIHWFHAGLQPRRYG